MTTRSRQILAFVERYAAEHGYAPSVENICEGVGLRSKGTVHSHLRQLRSQGKVDWVDGESRTVHVVRRAA